jgi:hypothetical protein
MRRLQSVIDLASRTIEVIIVPDVLSVEYELVFDDCSNDDYFILARVIGKKRSQPVMFYEIGELWELPSKIVDNALFYNPISDNLFDVYGGDYMLRFLTTEDGRISKEYCYCYKKVIREDGNVVYYGSDFEPEAKNLLNDTSKLLSYFQRSNNA